MAPLAALRVASLFPHTPLPGYTSHMSISDRTPASAPSTIAPPAAFSSFRTPDAMSARVIEQAGATAIATTSAGVSWALGRPDGHGAARDDVLAVVRRIVGAVAVPVTADVEGGYDDVAATVRGVIAAGASGINLEDSPGRNDAPLLDPAEQVARIAAARAAAKDSGLFINARTDVYLRQVGPESGRVEETVRRAKAYTEAGADGLFVPGLVEPEAIRRIAAA